MIANQDVNQEDSPRDSAKWLGRLREFVEGGKIAILASGIAMFTLALAVVQMIQISKQTETLARIAEALPTRYLGAFPDYFPRIVSLMEDATETIDIACDMPAYADLSDRETWLKYDYCLKQKIHNDVKIRMQCYNDEKRRQLVNSQFTAEDWDSWSSQPKNREKLRKFLQSWAPGVCVDSLDREQVIEYLMDEQLKVEKSKFDGASLVTIGDNMPVYFWVFDGRAAIFAIPIQTDPFKTVAFETYDQRLIDTMSSGLREFYQGLRHLTFSADVSSSIDEAP